MTGICCFKMKLGECFMNFFVVALKSSNKLKKNQKSQIDFVIDFLFATIKADKIVTVL